jgi:hypothetical protein
MLLNSGCKSTPKPPKPVPWSVTITKQTPASIEVDLVGVSPSEKPYWQNNVRPDDYWKNGPVRQAAQKVTTTFKEGATFTLPSTDPIWKQWFGYGTTELMIMANLPGKYDNGPYDRRRVFVPLDKKAWESKDKTIKIQILDEFIRVLTPPRQP